jgi:cytochrome oxidase Cu insertion factor (SCO1/SenC/PrrC family)
MQHLSVDIVKPLRLGLVVGLLVLVLLAGCKSKQPEGITVGAVAPDFTLVSAVEGQPVALSDYQGQPVLLFFHMAMG